MSATPVFALQHVSFAYEQIPALRDLSLTIDRGQSLALVGANGSGKVNPASPARRPLFSECWLNQLLRRAALGGKAPG